MKIKVKLFGSMRRIVGQDELDMEFTKGIKIDEIIERLLADYPELEKPIKYTIISLNHVYAHGEEVIQNGDELALLPPIAGG